ncbi:MAG: DUF4270 domain-containing protein [Prevotellaceae bacterium]|jgi:hypothetical protein|nr:DUF4270 domain-containing protein [Prevotellaceae bacterium]
MKFYHFIIAAAVAAGCLACQTDDTVGLSIRPEQDAITVIVDTFIVRSENYHIEAISAQCSDSLSMLLGNYYSAKYGATKAELVIQFAAPEGYVFPDIAYQPQADSLALILYYFTWFGSKVEPLELSIYELNKQTPNYSTNYLSDFSVSDFTDATAAQLLGRKVFTSIDQSLSDSVLSGTSFIPTLRYTFPDTIRDRFFNFPQTAYASNEEFLKWFKGLYLTTTYGSSTMIYLREVNLRLYYHYTDKKNGNDTTVNTYITYPANKEVRQLNHISHPNIDQVMMQVADSVQLVKNTGGIYPKLHLPVGRIRQQIHDSIGDKILTVNSAILSVELTELDSSATAMPIPADLLMLKESQLNNLILKNSIATSGDSIGVIASYNSSTKEYLFDIARLLSANIKSNPTDYLKEETVLLIPVDRIFNESGTTIGIKIRKRLGAFTIRSAANGYSPMRIELVYSGF